MDFSLEAVWLVNYIVCKDMQLWSMEHCFCWPFQNPCQLDLVHQCFNTAALAGNPFKKICPICLIIILQGVSPFEIGTGGCDCTENQWIRCYLERKSILQFVKAWNNNLLFGLLRVEHIEVHKKQPYLKIGSSEYE